MYDNIFAVKRKVSIITETEHNKNNKLLSLPSRKVPAKLSSKGKDFFIIKSRLFYLPPTGGY